MTPHGVALLFAGQGSQAAGMLDDALASAPFAQDLLAAADARLSRPLSRLMREGPAEALLNTELAQPALLTIGVLHALRLRAQGIEPRMLIGHSVGQFAALVAAGAIAFEPALELLQARARAMAAAMPPEGGAMAAILGADRAAVYAACRQGQALGVVGVACHNAPDQTVISGTRPAVDAVGDALDAAGFGVVPLAVSIATHSELLRPAADALAPVVARCPIADPQAVVIDNVTAHPLTTARAVRASILRQLTAPVLFQESIEAVRALGVATFIQCGPGDVLLRCVRRQFPAAACSTFADASVSAVRVA